MFGHQEGLEPSRAQTEPIKLTVVDNQPVVIAGVRSWSAAAYPPIRIVAAGPSIGIVWTTVGGAADVILLALDNTAPVFADLRRLVDAGRRVVVFAMHDDTDTASTCQDLGALAYLSKTEHPAHLITTVQAAVHDRQYNPSALRKGQKTGRHRARPSLSQREVDVLVEWFQSESKSMVAQKLGLSLSTVNSYLERVRDKYAGAGRPARTKAALVARAIQDDLVRLSDL